MTIRIVSLDFGLTNGTATDPFMADLDLRGQLSINSETTPVSAMDRGQRCLSPRFPAAALMLIVVGLGPLQVVRSDDLISYSRQIQPILARKCFACHGPDDEQRQADLRLDQRESAIAIGAIVPLEADESEMLRRISSDDPDEQMPPPSVNERVTDAELGLLRAWISAGADYEPHWAFLQPVRPRVPELTILDSRRSNSPIDRAENAIDHFVAQHHRQHQLEAAPRADRYTLVRRLYLDLLGFPPTFDEAERFVRDPDPDAYDKLVDRLLLSPHYGEHWARDWLDLARYSDTNGYEKDRPRSIWPYRDWVVRSLNADMPFDRFTIEQLAGDMLPNATENQRIATGFHRNSMLNEEGGIDPLEYRYYAVVDRVATIGTIWLGLTTGCAQCHSHKFDPISHTDYYRLFALINNADEPDLRIPVPRVAALRDHLEQKIQQLERELPSHFPPVEGDAPIEERRRRNFERQFNTWLDDHRASAVDWSVLRPAQVQSNLPRLETLPDGSIFSTGDITKRDVFQLAFEITSDQLPVTALRLEVLPDDRLPAGGPGRTYYEGRQGDFFLSEVAVRYEGDPVALVEPSHSFGRISIGSGTADAANVIDHEGSTGWSTAEQEGQANQWVVNLRDPIIDGGTLAIEMLFERHYAASLGRFRWSVTAAGKTVRAKSLPPEIESLLAKSAESWTSAERALVRRFYCRVAPELAEARKPIDQLRQQLPPFPTSLVMQERPADNPRPTFRHHRGEYLASREEVTPGVPAIFSPLPQDKPANRLTLARWLVSDANPLVARVAVNRAWQSFFGTGLVESSGDFGTQSDPPTHPQLLDWLACQFIDDGWSLKKLHRMIVMSRTYQQASTASPEAYRADPVNRHLARGPRQRLDAEQIRDSMLRVAGCLTLPMGGPGVYPPQPASVTAMAYGEVPWSSSLGEDRYRRSLYTFSKRTAPFAAYAVFDAPSGEFCVAQRDRSNTPLQALTLLNDEMFLEMSRALARTAVEDFPTPGFPLATPSEHDPKRERKLIKSMFGRVLTRPPSDEETHAIQAFYQTQLRRLNEGTLSAAAVIGEPTDFAKSDNRDTPRGAASNVARDGLEPDGAWLAQKQLAAWTLVARALMNLDEAVTKP